MNCYRVAPLAALAFAALASQAQAQDVPVQRVSGDVKHYRLDYSTGEITQTSPAGDTLVSSCYANSAFSGLFAVPGAGEEFVDWGVKACGLTDVACEIIVGYGTTALDPLVAGPGAAFDVTLYSGTSGFCDTKTPVATYSFTGMPGSVDGSAVAVSMTVDISAIGFAIPDGPLGWGYVEVDGETGPLLMTAGAGGSGTIDAFDVYTAPAETGPCGGTFAFMTPGVASFWMEIGEDDGSFGAGSQVQRFGAGGCNIGVLTVGSSSPAVSKVWNPSITTPAVATPALDFLAFAKDPGPGGCGPFGEILIDLTPPNPLIVISGVVGTGSPFSAPVPPLCALIGATATCQAGQVDVGGQIALTNAIDLVIGV
ncbi:MAG: hypothetical protein AAF682_04530 [Planctomycetota bacterium]